MKEKKTSVIFRILVILTMLIIVLLLVWYLLLKPKEDDPMAADIRARLGQLDGKSENEIAMELNRVVEEGMFHIAVNAIPVFADGTSEGTLEIENVPNNHYDMRVEIYLKDGTQVYQSGLISPNYHIQRDRLTKVLPKGDYPALVCFYAYDRETKIEMGSMSAEIVLRILN